MRRLALLSLFLVLSAIVTVPAGAAIYSATVLGDGPLGYYRMDETSGTTALDSAPPAQNGTYVDGPVLNQAGPQSPAFPGFEGTNRAVQFDGSNDHMLAASLPFSNTTTYTYEAWVNNTRANNAQAITGYVGSRGTPTGYDALGIMGTYSGTRGSLFLWNGAGGTLVQGTTATAPNTWHHVAYTRSGTNVAVYLDGALQASSATHTNNVASNDVFTAMRADGFAPTQGRVDEVAVYDNTVLSAAQINAHYNAAFSTGLYSINNAHFELQDVDLPNLNQTGQGDGGYSNDVLQGWWGNAHAFGVFDTTDAHYAGTSGDSNPIPGGDGDQVGYITTFGEIISVSQTLPDPIQAGDYTFTLAVGSRLNRASAGYELAMLAGGTVVASEADAISLPIGGLTDRSISFSVAQGSPLIGELLTLRISNTIAPPTGLLSTDFDNARLTFQAAVIPEPSSLAVMLLPVGLILLLAWRRRDR
jgi:hypothetical protein